MSDDLAALETQRSKLLVNSTDLVWSRLVRDQGVGRWRCRFARDVNLRQASRWLQAFGMSNLRYTYCFRTRQNQDAARPTRFPDHGASRKGQSRAACSLVSLPTFRRYQGTAEDHGQDCGAIQKVRRHDSGPGEKDRFLSLIFATVLLPLLRIFWISGLQQTLCL